MSSPYQKTYFLLSAANVKQLPPDQGIEVAIVGRSNAGKSTTLNCITEQKSLARVSKTPGRTQLINVFIIDAGRRLIDLPGYGYAKAPLSAKEKWQKTIDQYVSTRHSLQGIILVMDIRHPLKELDVLMINYCTKINLPVHILLNKMDKISRGAASQTLKKVQMALTQYGNSVTLQGFSAGKKVGILELYNLLDKWYQLNT